MSTVLVEIENDVLLDNHASIELGLVVSIPVKVHKVFFGKTVEDIERALEAFDSLVEISDDKELDCHDKEAYSEEIISKFKRGVK